jgi:hypothetical protein
MTINNFFFKNKKVESKELTTPKFIHNEREEIQDWGGLRQNPN